MSARRDTKRRVNFLTETYVEDRERIEHLASLVMTGHFGVCWCIHDKDREPDGSLKKAHCHTVIHLDNAMSRSAFVRNFAIRDRMVQTCSVGDEIEDLDGALLYLIHADKKSRDEGKFQYPLESIKGPMANYARKRILQLLHRKDDSEKKESASFLTILEYIESSLHLTMTALSRWCAENGHWAAFRRSSGIIRDCLKEHNDYLAQIAATKDFYDYEEQLRVSHDKDVLYQELGVRALRTLNTLLHQAGKPSLKLIEQIEGSEEALEITKRKKMVELTEKRSSDSRREMMEGIRRIRGY